MQVDAWAMFYRSELYQRFHERFHDLRKDPLDQEPGIFSVPPPVLDLTFALGLWDAINARMGTGFEMTEEEEMPPEVSRAVADEAEALARKVGQSRWQIKRVVGIQIKPSRRKIKASMRRKDLSDWLLRLADFLRRESADGSTICAYF